MLLKLQYAKFDVSRLFRSEVIKEKPLGGRLEAPPPLVKEGLKLQIFQTDLKLWSRIVDNILDCFRGVDFSCHGVRFMFSCGVGNFSHRVVILGMEWPSLVVGWLCLVIG